MYAYVAKQGSTPAEATLCEKSCLAAKKFRSASGKGSINFGLPEQHAIQQTCEINSGACSLHDPMDFRPGGSS